MNAGYEKSSFPVRDVRMRGFAERAAVEEIWHWLDAQTSPLETEPTPLHDAAGRTLSDDIVSRCDVPSFPRAMMDGFAVRAADTWGASAYDPLKLKVCGESWPGRPFTGTMAAGQAVKIMTGAPLPEGADAVAPVEIVEFDGAAVRISGALPTGKHVGAKGEDVQTGRRVLRQGRRLRPQDLGLLASLGMENIPLVRRPRVRIVVTGNEVAPAHAKLRPFQIRDANGPMLRALVARDGGLLLGDGVTPDDPQAIAAALQSDADIVIVSGGSSVGEEDHAPSVLAQLGEIAFHGVAMRPSSPTGMGKIGQRLVFLLPGNPVSCLFAYDFFAGRAVRRQSGGSNQWPYRSVRLPLGRKLVSQVGRVDCVRVRVAEGLVEPMAIGGASVLTSTTRADGFVITSEDSEGLAPGSQVHVFLYDI